MRDANRRDYSRAVKLTSHLEWTVKVGNAGLCSCVLLACLASGCRPAAATPALSPLMLPAIRPLAGCLGIGMEGTLRGASDDPRVAWLIVDGRRVDVVWPTGYSAVFTPGLEILDEGGKVVLRGGDGVAGGCVLDGGFIYVAPPFR